MKKKIAFDISVNISYPNTDERHKSVFFTTGYMMDHFV